MDPEKNMLIAELEDARAQLNQALQAVSSQTQVTPAWKVKHLLDHVIGWDVLVAAAFRTHAMGGTPEETVRNGIDDYNAQMVRERQELSDEQSRRAYDDARVELLSAIREMPEDRLGMEFAAPWGGSCSVAQVVQILVHHEREHARQISDKLR